MNKRIKDNKKELTNIERIYENERVELNLATHNINGLKTNSQKFEALYKWIIDNELDIVGLAETNISAKEGFFLGKSLEEYKNFWSSASPDKKKGSGIGLLISKKWEKHLGQIERTNEYMISASFFFKQVEIIIIMVYLLPNDKEERKVIQKSIIDKYIKRLPRTQIVVIGDFNATVNKSLDRSSSQKKKQVKSDLLLS